MNITKATNFRWVMCAMLFAATTVNYLDRQVLSLTWADFIAPEFHWTDTHYGNITGWFSLLYACAMLFAGRFIDWCGTKKGYAWAITIWSVGACLHALCGLGTRLWVNAFSDGAILSDKMAMIQASGNVALMITSVSVWFFIIARFVLAVGEAGNFPAAIKVTAEYFPKKDRAFSTAIFNAGAQIGPLIAPLTIPLIAQKYGWEMAFIIIGALGFIWMGVWLLLYAKPEQNKHVNEAELEYIHQDDIAEGKAIVKEEKKEKSSGIFKCLKHKQTWAFAVGKFMTDGVWWFFLFWTPAYLSSVYGYSTASAESRWAIFVLYAITMISLVGGYLPTYFVNKKHMHPFNSRMRSMLIFAFFPLLALFAQPLGTYSYWFPIIIIGIVGAAHQSWSANIFSTVGDMFPKRDIATVTGIGGMAGGLGCFLVNTTSGRLFDFAEATNMQFMGFEGKPAGYFIIFCFCAVAYLIGWIIMKSLVPQYKPIEE